MSEETKELLKSLAPYITALASYLWRLTSPSKQHTLVRYAFLLSFALASLIEAWFAAKLWLVIVTVVVLVASAIFLKPRDGDDSADVAA